MTLREFIELNIIQEETLEEAITATVIKNTFPSKLRNYTEIHSRADLQGILKDFGRGYFVGNKPEFTRGMAASHPGGAEKRFYWGIDEGGVLYIVAKNNMYADFISKRSKILANIIGDKNASINVPEGITVQSGGRTAGFGKQKVNPAILRVYNKINKTKGLMKAEKFMSEYNAKKIDPGTLEKLKTWAQAA